MKSRADTARALRWATLALTLAALCVLYPLWVPLVLAAWTAIIARPLLERVAKALRGRQRAAGALMLVLVLVALAPLAVLSVTAVSGVGELVALVQASDTPLAVAKALVSSGAGEAPLVLPTSAEGIAEFVQQHGSRAFGLLSGVAGAALRGILGLLIYFAGTYSFLVEGPRLYQWAVDHSPLDPLHLARLAGAFSETGRGLFIGVGLTASAQATVATVAYLALGIPRALVLGLVTGIAAFVPVVGAALVWFPVSAGLYLTGHPVKAAVMLLLGLLVISSMDNVLRPVFFRYGRLDLPLFALFCAVFGGLLLLGPFGAMLGPLVLRLAKEALALYREDQQAPAPGPS